MFCRCMTSLVAASKANCPSCKTKLSIASTQRKPVQDLPTFATDDAPVIDLSASSNFDNEATESEDEF